MTKRTSEFLRPQLRGLLTLFFAVLISGCGASDLERDDAKEIIEQAEEWSTLKRRVSTVLSFDSLEFQMTKQGIIALQKNGKSISDGASADIAGTEGATIITARNQDVNISISGIRSPTSESTERVVEFEWSYRNLPNVIGRFAIEGGSGSARIVEYDNGWRLGNINIENGTSSYPLTAQDQGAVEADLVEATVSRQSLFEGLRSWRNRGAKLQSVRYNKTLSVDIYENGIVIPRRKFVWFGQIKSVSSYYKYVKFRENFGVINDVRATDYHTGRDEADDIAEAISQGKQRWTRTSGGASALALKLYDCEELSDRDACAYLGLTSVGRQVAVTQEAVEFPNCGRYEVQPGVIFRWDKGCAQLFDGGAFTLFTVKADLRAPSFYTVDPDYRPKQMGSRLLPADFGEYESVCMVIAPHGTRGQDTARYRVEAREGIERTSLNCPELNE